MSRYIDADALKVILNKVEEECERDWFKGNEFREMIDITPTIEVKPDNGWISVKDRLPESGVPVLALQFDIPHQRIRYRLVQLVIRDIIDPSTGEKMMSWFPNYGGRCVENIAYWQPLPELPKGK